jgi:hypothetical protein
MADEGDLTPFDAIAEITDAGEKEAALRERLTIISSLNGRLLFLEDAARHEPLRSVADGIRKELLLLSGRTEEAEKLLLESGNRQSELGLRLAINHGKIPLSMNREGAVVPGLDLSSLEELSNNNPGSPEYYAERRGMIFSAAFLLSPQVRMHEDTASVEADQSVFSGGSEVSEGISIQVGAFSRKENATAHLEYLEGRGISAEILASTRQDGTKVYKTIISGIPQNTAQRELIRLKEKGIEGFILR